MHQFSHVKQNDILDHRHFTNCLQINPDSKINDATLYFKSAADL